MTLRVTEVMLRELVETGEMRHPPGQEHETNLEMTQKLAFWVSGEMLRFPKRGHDRAIQLFTSEFLRSLSTKPEPPMNISNICCQLWSTSPEVKEWKSHGYFQIARCLVSHPTALPEAVSVILSGYNTNPSSAIAWIRSICNSRGDYGGDHDKNEDRKEREVKEEIIDQHQKMKAWLEGQPNSVQEESDIAVQLDDKMNELYNNILKDVVGKLKMEDLKHHRTTLETIVRKGARLKDTEGWEQAVKYKLHESTLTPSDKFGQRSIRVFPIDGKWYRRIGWYEEDSVLGKMGPKSRVCWTALGLLQRLKKHRQRMERHHPQYNFSDDSLSTGNPLRTYNLIVRNVCDHQEYGILYEDTIGQSDIIELLKVLRHWDGARFEHVVKILLNHQDLLVEAITMVLNCYRSGPITNQDQDHKWYWNILHRVVSELPLDRLHLYRPVLEEVVKTFMKEGTQGNVEWRKLVYTTAKMLLLKSFRHEGGVICASDGTRVDA